MALHIGSSSTACSVKTPLFRRTRQRSINTGNPNEVSSANCFLNVCGPGRVGRIGGAPANNLVAYEASPDGALRYKTGCNAEANNGHAALCSQPPEHHIKSDGIASAFDGSDPSRPHRNMCLSAEAGRGNDEARP